MFGIMAFQLFGIRSSVTHTVFHPTNSSQPNPSLAHQHIRAHGVVVHTYPYETDDLYIPVRLVSFGARNRRVGGMLPSAFPNWATFYKPVGLSANNSCNLVCSSLGFMTWLAAVSDSLIASNRPSINKDTTGNYHVGFDYVGV